MSDDLEKASDHSREAEHIENGTHDIHNAAYRDHRADDDRDETAMGRNSDKFDKSYWLSVNFIGSLFAIGMAFMGGIGGMSILGYIGQRHDEYSC